MGLSVGDETSLIKSSSQAYQVDSSVLCNSSECAQEVLPQLEMQGDLPSSGAVGWGQFEAAFCRSCRHRWREALASKHCAQVQWSRDEAHDGRGNGNLQGRCQYPGPFRPSRL